jgi:hypothetical protein
VTAVASASIDKANVVVDRGEMSFGLFDFDEDKLQVILNKKKPLLQSSK